MAHFPFIVVIAILILTFLIRMPIAFGMLSASVWYFVFSGVSPSRLTGVIINQANSNYVLMAVPLFIFAAKVMNSGKVTDRVFSFAKGLVGRFRGGMAHVNIVASIIFSGMSGSALADAAGLGIMELDAMHKEGYDDAFSCALIASSATIGPIFPPSLPMIVYSMLSGASVGALFMGGMLPGLLIGAALMLYVGYIARKRNFPRSEIYKLSEFLKATADSTLALLTPVILLGGIYTGVMTPTEAGAVASFYAILISFFAYKALGLRKLYAIMVETAESTGTIGLLIFGAFGFSFIVASEQIPEAIAGVMMSFSSNPIIFLMIVNVFFLLAGMFINVTTLQLVFIPMVLPLVNRLGIDLVHFGVLISLNMMIGLVTPPMGMLLFIVADIGKVELQKIISAIFPQILVLITVLLIVTYYPPLTLWIPGLLLGK
jgi:tripartite ATP-independent transporter DctM subunit